MCQQRISVAGLLLDVAGFLLLAPEWYWAISLRGTEKEKLNDPVFRTVSRPDGSVMNYLGQILTYEANPVFYEIGVGVGATTLSVAKLLNNRGRIVLFSREQDVRELAVDLSNEGFNNIEASWGSPNKIYSGYHFELARGLVEDLLPPFDLAYIDGGMLVKVRTDAISLIAARWR